MYKDLEVMVRVDSDNYAKCVEASHNCWSSQKNDEWGKTFINTKDDSRRSERTGYLGEMVFGQMIGEQPDLSYKEGGGKHDFVLHGRSFEVKNARHDIYEGLLRCVNQSGTKIKLKSDCYVFCYVAEEDIEAGYAVISVVGYASREFISSLEPVRSWAGEHWNYEVDYNSLGDIADVVQWYSKTKMEASHHDPTT